MRLLHIDNDEIFSAKIKKIVEDNDVVYISADSYEKAGEIITEIKVDLVIITEQMDGVSCKAFIEKLKLEKSTLTPVIVISEDHSDEKKSVYFDMGIMSYLTKAPFSNKRFEYTRRKSRFHHNTLYRAGKSEDNNSFTKYRGG